MRAEPRPCFVNRIAHFFGAVAFVSTCIVVSACARHGGSSILPPLQGSGRTTLAAADYASTVLADSPTAYYRLDDTGTTALDSSGNALNATIGSSVTAGVAGLLTGTTDTAMGLPGVKSSAGAIMGTQTPLLQPTNAVSLEFWMRFTTLPALYTVPVAYGSDVTYAPYDVYFGSNGKLVAQFALNTGTLVVTSNVSVAVNTTYHIVSTYDGTTGKLYINGVLVGSATKTGTFTNYLSGFGLSIGDDAAFDDPPFKGTLDEVAVYAGKALTQTQIQNHYNAGIGATPTPSPSASPSPSPSTSPSATPPPSGYAATVLGDTPTAYYRLDDTGSTAFDSSGNGLNATYGSSVTENAPGLLLGTTDTGAGLPGIKNTSGTITGSQTTMLQPSNAVSLEFWMRFPSAPPLYTVAVGYGSDITYAPYDVYFGANGKLVAQFMLSSGVLVVTSSSPVATNSTYHVVSTFDGTTAKLYINGVLSASATKSGTLSNYVFGYGLSIGDDATFDDPPFKGTIDEVAVYAGKALTQTQVDNHYIAGGGTVVTPSPSPTPVPTPTPTPGTVVDWQTFGYDLQRTGYNSKETTINTGNVSSLKALWAQNASVGNGAVGEPVVAMNVNVNGTLTNMLYTGAQSGLLYAINADTGATVWTQQLGTTPYKCGTFGIEGTPVIDRASNRIYVPDGLDQVHALDLATGAEAPGYPVNIAPTPDHNFIYAGLTYNPANGILYAETSSTCDIVPWYGRIDAIMASTGAILGTFFPTQGTSGGGIWGFGGASIDPSTNNVFIAVGNADTTGGVAQNSYYAEHIVELSADVSTVLASNYPALHNSIDADFGATPLLFQPPGCPSLLAALNKSGDFVLYNRGNINNGPVQQIQMSISTDAGDFIGVPAYDPVTNLVYVGLPSTFGSYVPGMAAFGITGACKLNPTPVWSAAFGPDGALTTNDVPRSPITIANGIAYVAGFTDDTVHAFDASNGTPLWSGALNSLGVSGPVVVNGRLYVAAYGGSVYAWYTGILPDKHR